VSANLTEGGNLTIENRIVPYSVFTDRRFGRVGMTEEGSAAASKEAKVRKDPNELGRPPDRKR